MLYRAQNRSANVTITHANMVSFLSAPDAKVEAVVESMSFMIMFFFPPPSLSFCTISSSILPVRLHCCSDEVDGVSPSLTTGRLVEMSADGGLMLSP